MQQPEEEIEFLGSVDVTEEPPSKQHRSLPKVDQYKAESEDEFNPSKGKLQIVVLFWYISINLVTAFNKRMPS